MKQLGGLICNPQFQATIHCGRAVKLAGTWNIWSHQCPLSRAGKSEFVVCVEYSPELLQYNTVQGPERGTAHF